MAHDRHGELVEMDHDCHGKLVELGHDSHGELVQKAQDPHCAHLGSIIRKTTMSHDLI